MRILLLTDEVWNDRIHGNNVLSNWFVGFSAEFAQIYCSPGLPGNECCREHYQITDKMMVDSLLHGKPAGKTIRETESKPDIYNSTDIGHLSFLRKHCGSFLRFCKSVVWTLGSYDTEELRRFVADFSPDIVFCPRMATPKMLKLERTIHRYTDAPFAAFTGDAEYSFPKTSLSPFAWINSLWTRSSLRRNVRFYSLYYSLSDEQRTEYEKLFLMPVRILRKCAPSDHCAPRLIPHEGIRFMYAGKLYCNRWKTLLAIGKAMDELNADGDRLSLDVYTRDRLSDSQKKAFRGVRSVRFCGAIPAETVMEKYREYDASLHVESFDRKYRYATQYSFSTKIIDCLCSGTALVAIAWEKHSGLTYLERENAAICVSDVSGIKDALSEIVRNPDVLREYRQRAAECIARNHLRENVQKQLYSDFSEIIENART